MKFLKMLKVKPMTLFLMFNVVGTIVGTVLILMSMTLATSRVTQQEKMSLEEYLSFHKVFSEKPILFTLRPFAVNLASENNESTVMLELNLEVMNELGYQELVSKKDFVRDTVLKVVSEKEANEITTIQGKLFLKDDIAVAVNEKMENAFVKGVYFTSFKVDIQ